MRNADHGRSIRRMAAGAAVVLAAGIAPFVVAGPASASASGSVDCGNGKRVEGVWMNAGDRSGWAYIWEIEGPYRVGWYREEVNQNSWYSIDVGCGSWQPTYHSDYTNVHSGDFVCVPKVSKTSSYTNKCWDS
ncbi:hypothetical protein ACFYO1_15770 [Nocardia sp. NPDC006044]|uniref:hypothetical protein n=1 Tax=Nocardia sp. NPDC006044 TaxID=3364306 RepID=UPI00369548C9